MKRSPLKRKSKSTRAKLYAELDNLIKSKCRKIGRCQRCGSVDNLQAHHIIRVANSTFLRWEPRNLICLCQGCHMWLHKRSTFDEENCLYRRAKSDSDMRYILDNQHTEGKYSMSDLREMLDEGRGNERPCMEKD